MDALVPAVLMISTLPSTRLNSSNAKPLVASKWVEVAPPKRLKFSWVGMPQHSPSIVTYELSPTAGGTRLHFAHDGFDSSYGFMSGLMVRAMMRAGWKHKFRDLLPLVLANVAGRHGQPVSGMRCG